MLSITYITVGYHHSILKRNGTHRLIEPTIARVAKQSLPRQLKHFLAHSELWDLNRFRYNLHTIFDAIR